MRPKVEAGRRAEAIFDEPDGLQVQVLGKDFNGLVPICFPTCCAIATAHNCDSRDDISQTRRIIERAAMLLRFTVENVLCFRDENVFSMVASADEKHPTHVVGALDKNRPSALRAAAIYGANGHGKTKFVEALQFLQKAVVDGIAPDAAIPLVPFRLDATSEKTPSRIIINFRVGTTDYEYGVVLDKTRVHEEWLFGRFNKREQEIFTRVTPESSDGTPDVTFGRKLKGLKSPSPRHSMPEYLDFLSIDVRDNQLMIKELADREIPIAKEVSSWFDDMLVIVPADSNYSGLHQRVQNDQEFLNELTDFVRGADIGITKVGVVETKVSPEKIAGFPERFLETLKSNMDKMEEGNSFSVGTADGPAMIVRKEKDGELTFLQLQTEHAKSGGGVATFDIFEESSGTRRLLDLIPMLADSRASDRVFVVDEIDRKLHPILAYNFIEKFLSCPNGQIIFTTHNTLLLTLDLLRRDEIWFSQKKTDGSVELYSLDEFKVRPDLDIRKGYLFGRFGAVPVLADPASTDCAEGVLAN